MVDYESKSTGKQNMNPNPIPDGYHSITPYLKLPNAGRLVEFLKKAFDGVEIARLTKPDGSVLHAEMLIGDLRVMVHELPLPGKPKPSTLYLYVADIDATYKQAIEAGAVSVFEPANMYYGARTACITDVSGNEWWIATRIETLTLDQVQERANAFIKARTQNTLSVQSE
jgi:PhnB protein